MNNRERIDKLIINKFKKGKSIKDIAEETGYCRETIINRLNKNGIATKKDIVDITGVKKGKLTAIKFSEIRKSRHFWLFKCDCGKEKTLSKGNVISGKTTSCGCVAHNISGESYKELTTFMWSNLKRSARYRGLKIDLTIKEAYELFEKQDGKCRFTGIEIKFGTDRFKPTASLDRINSKMDYSVENCQWIHKDVNRMKVNYSDEYFIETCGLVKQTEEMNQLKSKIDTYGDDGF